MKIPTGMKRLRTLGPILVGAAILMQATAAPAPPADAQKLYDQTEYHAALTLLQKSGQNSAAAWELTGRCRYMLGDFKPAIEAFEKAVQFEPNNAGHHLWLGRAWGRRAETSVFLLAPKYAVNAREQFEKAVALSPGNMEAVNDLFSYYLDAPGMLGGGIDRATKLTELIRKNDPIEYHYALAQLAVQRKQYDLAEGQYRKAVELAPRQVNRLVDLAKFLAGRGKVKESEEAFQDAAKIDANDKKLLYTRAETYVKSKRNLDTAKKLLETYMQCRLTPEDPSREDARKLLLRANGASD